MLECALEPICAKILWYHCFPTKRLNYPENCAALSSGVAMGASATQLLSRWCTRFP